MRLLTTSEAAQIAGVSARIICGWVDRKAVQGFRVPGSCHRRIPLVPFVEFLRREGFPTENLERLLDSDARREPIPVCRTWTTGQIAVACDVAPRTVAKWCDSGILPSYRIACGKDRRILHSDLVSFLDRQGMPSLSDFQQPRFVLCVGVSEQFISVLRRPGREVHLAVTGFDAGVLATSQQFTSVIIDFALGRGESLVIAHHLRRLPAYEHVVIVALANEDEHDIESVKAAGFDDVFIKPCDPELVCERLNLE